MNAGQELAMKIKEIMSANPCVLYAK